MGTFTLPDDLGASSLDDLTALETEAVAAFDALASTDADDLTDEQLDEMESIAAAVAAIRSEYAARDAATAARRDRVEAARAAVVAPEVEAEPGTEEVVPVITDVPEQEAVAAAGTAVATTRPRPSVRQVSTKAPVRLPSRTSGTGITLTAAADIPGVVAGSQMDGMAAVAKAFAARSRAFPKTRVDPARARVSHQYGVASFGLDFGDLLTKNDESDYDTVMRAGQESRLPGGSLIAAGGWCAPSETFYDLCGSETLDGLVDIPEVGVNRGGIRFTRGPDFSDIYENTGFCQTEAEAIAGEEKECYGIECPPFEEVRLDACGLCITAPLLTNAGYPELVERWLSGALIAHQHKMSARVINSMVAIAGATHTVTGGAGTGFDVLTAIEWSAVTQRYRWRMSTTETLEVLAPVWLQASIRADLALRTGQPEATVTDAQLASYFADRGVRVQWVYDWQPLDLDPAGTPAGGNACFAPIPATVELLVYPAGTFVKGTADVISLDAVYDNALLRTNTYTAAFFEEGILVANRCYDACSITVPVCGSGLTGGVTEGCWNAAVTP